MWGGQCNREYIFSDLENVPPEIMQIGAYFTSNTIDLFRSANTQSLKQYSIFVSEVVEYLIASYKPNLIDTVYDSGFSGVFINARVSFLELRKYANGK